MPFTKHIIQPTNIAQCPLPSGEPNELECLSNLTLANVVRQLSSVGEHACRIFAELSAQAQELTQRSEQMGKRIEQLSGKCAQLDIQTEELCVNDQMTKKQFKSASKIEQQVVSRRTMPEAMRILYESADAPPSLEKLNPYRTDGKDCLKFYTDPEFFFNIWCNELIKDNEARKIEKKRRKTKNENPNVTTRQATAGGGGVKQAGQHQPPDHQILHLPSTNLPIDPNLQMLMLMQQQKAAMQQQMVNHYGVNEPYSNPAKQMLLMGGQQQQQFHQQPGNQFNQMDAINEETIMMMQLPPPPASLQLEQNNYQVYAESHSMNNGARLSKMSVQQQHQQQNRNSTERPVFPPPPVPDQNVSDLQQIMRKFTINNEENNGPTEGLPPPPSPPDFTELNIKKTNMMVARESHQSYTGNTHIQETSTTASYQADTIMMNLPLPPMDLIAPNGDQIEEDTSLPPPIPSLSTQPDSPPLPAADNDVSTSSNVQQVSATPTASVATPSASKSTTEVSQNSRSFLNDINEGRFTLKPTQRNEILNSSGLDSSRRKVTSMQEEHSASSKSNSLTGHGANSRATLEPFVNNSDVAAIIDFVRKFRPHVCHSSDDEDETGSDWDD